ncbi:hypothetical protein BJX66DRAFT_308320 [Aspergillus keveii]|uniref:Uncharacterized protein n=1 Tax=Aspergillus keveii TaxID=714993 RepID=A0ABR4FZJ5_9EURO
MCSSTPQPLVQAIVFIDLPFRFRRPTAYSIVSWASISFVVRVIVILAVAAQCIVSRFSTFALDHISSNSRN